MMTYLVRAALLVCCFNMAQAMDPNQDTIPMTRGTISLTQPLSLGHTDSMDESDGSATQRLSQGTEESEHSDHPNSDEDSPNSRASTLVQVGKRRLTYVESEDESGSTSTDSDRPISPLPGGTLVILYNEDGTIKSTNQGTNQTGTLQRSNAFIWDGTTYFNSPKFKNVKKRRK